MPTSFTWTSEKQWIQIQFLMCHGIDFQEEGKQKTSEFHGLFFFHRKTFLLLQKQENKQTKIMEKAVGRRCELGFHLICKALLHQKKVCRSFKEYAKISLNYSFNSTWLSNSMIVTFLPHSLSIKNEIFLGSWVDNFLTRWHFFLRYGLQYRGSGQNAPSFRLSPQCLV